MKRGKSKPDRTKDQRGSDLSQYTASNIAYMVGVPLVLVIVSYHVLVFLDNTKWDPDFIFSQLVISTVGSFVEMQDNGIDVDRNEEICESPIRPRFLYWHKSDFDGKFAWAGGKIDVKYLWYTWSQDNKFILIDCLLPSSTNDKWCHLVLFFDCGHYYFDEFAKSQTILYNNLLDFVDDPCQMPRDLESVAKFSYDYKLYGRNVGLGNISSGPATKGKCIANGVDSSVIIISLVDKDGNIVETNRTKLTFLLDLVWRVFDFIFVHERHHVMTNLRRT